MEIECFETAFSVCKLQAFPADVLSRPFSFAAKTDGECSLVCPEAAVPKGALAREDGWRMLRIRGTLDFSLTGVLAKISAVLAENGIAIFAVSTYDTDYLWVKKENDAAALAALTGAGYTVLPRGSLS